MFLSILNILLFIFVQNTNSLSITSPTKKYTKTIPNLGSIDVIEPFYKEEEKIPGVLFFTGGSSNMPNDIYSFLLNNIASNYISCYVFNNNIENVDYLLKILNKKHSSLSFVGHSSGCMTALEKSNYTPECQSIILFDPVDDRIIKKVKSNPIDTIFRRNKEKIIITQPENFIIIKSAKSYKWNFNPIRTPFIPFFGLNMDDIEFNNNVDEYEYDFDNDFDDDNELFQSNHNIKEKLHDSKKTLINLPDYGHCDIIDDKWSNMMHNSISEGIYPRNEKILDKYRDACSYIIKKSFTKISNKEIKKELIKTYKIKSSIHDI